MRPASTPSRLPFGADRRVVANLQRLAGNRAVTTMVVQRSTAEELISACTTLGVLSRSDLGARLLPLLRSGQYALVAETVTLANRSAVVDAMLGSVTPVELIRLARIGAARTALDAMSAQLSDAWFPDQSDHANGTLLKAVLGDQASRTAWNRVRVNEVKQSTNDVGALVAMFADDRIVDDDTVTSRLETILAVTAHLVIPGLQTGVDFGDTGFRGEPTTGGSGFRDPWPSSQNQVGHFLTAVGLEYSPELVSRPIPGFGSIRSMVQAPPAMSAQDVALRLTIGHEKAPDPAGGVEMLIGIIGSDVIERLTPGPSGETDEEREQRIRQAVERRIHREIDEVIAAFRRQFQSATDEDIRAWNAAQSQLDAGYNQTAMEGPGSPLNTIEVGTGKGNSRQDLRLSAVGWKFGQMIATGQFADRHAAAAWLELNLAATPSSPGPVGDFGPLVPGAPAPRPAAV